MKIFGTLFLTIPLIAFPQLKVEWHREIPSFEDDYVSGIIIRSANVVASLRAGHITCFSSGGDELWTRESNSGVYMLGKYGQHLYSQGYMHLDRRDENGNILKTQFLKNEDDNIISARNGQILGSCHCGQIY